MGHPVCVAVRDHPQSVARIRLPGKVARDALPPIRIATPVAGAHLGHTGNVGGGGRPIDEVEHRAAMINRCRLSVVHVRRELGTGAAPVQESCQVPSSARISTSKLETKSSKPT